MVERRVQHGQSAVVLLRTQVGGREGLGQGDSPEGAVQLGLPVSSKELGSGAGEPAGRCLGKSAHESMMQRPLCCAAKLASMQHVQPKVVLPWPQVGRGAEACPYS